MFHCWDIWILSFESVKNSLKLQTSISLQRKMIKTWFKNSWAQRIMRNLNLTSLSTFVSARGAYYSEYCILFCVCFWSIIIYFHHNFVFLFFFSFFVPDWLKSMCCFWLTKQNPFISICCRKHNHRIKNITLSNNPGNIMNEFIMKHGQNTKPSACAEWKPSVCAQWKPGACAEYVWLKMTFTKSLLFQEKFKTVPGRYCLLCSSSALTAKFFVLFICKLLCTCLYLQAWKLFLYIYEQ